MNRKSIVLLLTLFLLSGCTKNSSEDGFVSDPFSEHAEQTQNTAEKSGITSSPDTLESVREYIFSLGACGAAMSVDSETLIYD